LSSIRCNLLPDVLDDALEGVSCQNVIQYDAYTVDISTMPMIVGVINQFRAIVQDIGFEHPCTNFFIYVICSLLYQPCDIATFKLLAICQADCTAVLDLVNSCLYVVRAYNISVTFDCNRPSTYIPGVMLDSKLFDGGGNCLPFPRIENSGIKATNISLYVTRNKTI